jgi:two-component system OmpR family response regulator
MRESPVKPKILLVDDDLELVEMLKDYLEREDYRVDVVSDGLAATGKAISGDYALVVLDVMMPRVSGLEVLRCIRARSPVPVLMLTAKGEANDKVSGLELGADDYVPKPCTPRELSARIRAILRRTGAVSSDSPPMDKVAVGPLVIWPDRRQAELAGKTLNLTSTEFNLLQVLACSAGRPVSKEVLSARALGRPRTRYDRSIDVHLSSVRRKLAAAGTQVPMIETVHGLGYQLVRV